MSGRLQGIRAAKIGAYLAAPLVHKYPARGPRRAFDLHPTPFDVYPIKRSPSPFLDGLEAVGPTNHKIKETLL